MVKNPSDMAILTKEKDGRRITVEIRMAEQKKKCNRESLINTETLEAILIEKAG